MRNRGVCYTEVIKITGDPIEKEDFLEFRLLYEGEVLSSGNKSPRGPEKHAIRRAFHPQLKRLWANHKGLRELAAYRGNQSNPQPGATEEERVKRGINAIGKEWSRVGFEFVPLVTDAHLLRCSINILLLRPEEDRYVFERGDIDGQLKTIFDALKIPASAQEIGNSQPAADETPFFCLLEDDRLISQVEIVSDQLLMLPNKTKVEANDVFLTIHVKLNYKTSRTFDRYFD